MKFLLAVTMLLMSLNIVAQKVDFKVRIISLPPEVSYYDNQFSGLYIKDKNLFLMSESRLQDGAEAKLYSIKLADIEKQLSDSNYILPFTKWKIYNLNILRSKMKDNGDDYEGLEAMIIDKNKIYFSVETATPSNNCYLLKGIINDTAIVLDKNRFVTLAKPTEANGKHIYNAGFEAIAHSEKALLAFFEYNYFDGNNVVNNVVKKSFSLKGDKSFTMQRLPFRLTDITTIRRHTFTAVNYFYNGGGEDKIYRVLTTDTINNRLISDSGIYKSYTRLVSI